MVGAAVGTASCTPSGEQAPGPDEQPVTVRKKPREPAAALTIPPSAVGSIMIHRTQCYGTCPDYWAFIHSDGSVVYNGEAYVDHKGLRTGRVPVEDARALLGLASANGYFDSERDYSPGVTDNATVYTSVTVEGAGACCSQLRSRSP